MNESPSRDESAPSNPFPENELPKWLLRQGWIRLRRASFALHAPPYKMLAQFSFDLRTCVRSSGDLAHGLELCVRPIRNTRIGERWNDAADRIRAGSTLADALAGAEDYLPPFVLPVIRAGEQSGRLDEALDFLHSHCRLLAGPATTVRNLWFFPAVIMLGGSVLRVLLHLMLGSVGSAMSALWLDVLWWIQLAVIVALAMLTPARYFVDQVRLSLPLIGPLEREIALHRFFRILALLYSVGGYRVESMIRTASKTVSNHAARVDLCKAATAIEQHATISEAFRRVGILSADEKTTIETGEMSGTLESAFNHISEQTGASMESKLNFIQPILVRIVMGLVMLSLISTAFSLLI